MRGLLFSTIDTLIDTTTLQCSAFNTAFTQSSIQWHWSEDQFRQLKLIVGERHRIRWFAEHHCGQVITCEQAERVLRKKDKALDLLLCDESFYAQPYPGVLRLLEQLACTKYRAELFLKHPIDQKIYDHSVRHHDAFSSVRPAHSHPGLVSTKSARLEINTATSTRLSQSSVQSCVCIRAVETGSHAWVNHFGDIGNPAMQFSGHAILKHGMASLHSLLSLADRPEINAPAVLAQD